MTITKSGELASFYTVNKAPIKHLRVYFSPKQTGSGDPSPSNVREISGQNNVKTLKRGKNLVNISNDNIIYENYSWSKDGSYYSINDTTITLYNAEVKSLMVCFPALEITEELVGKQIILSAITTGTGDYGIFRSDLDGTNRSSSLTNPYIIVSSDIGRLLGVRIRINGYAGLYTANNIQLEFNSTATSYEPYRGQTYSLDWSNDIGTVYGGYVDLITGELVQTHNIQVYNGTENWDIENTASFYTASTRDSAANATYITCSHFPSNNYLVGGTNNNCFIWTSGNLNIQTTEIEHTAQAMKNFCLTQYNNGTPLTIAYPLITPITYTLTPTQLQTLLGRNNIWSNADRVEVEYELAESNDELYRRRNILLRSAPYHSPLSSQH